MHWRYSLILRASSVSLPLPVATAVRKLRVDKQVDGELYGHETHLGFIWRHNIPIYEYIVYPRYCSMESHEQVPSPWGTFEPAKVHKKGSAGRTARGLFPLWSCRKHLPVAVAEACLMPTDARVTCQIRTQRLPHDWLMSWKRTS